MLVHGLLNSKDWPWLFSHTENLFPQFVKVKKKFRRKNGTVTFIMWTAKGQLFSKWVFRCLQILPRNERKQVNLRYHST